MLSIKVADTDMMWAAMSVGSDVSTGVQRHSTTGVTIHTH